MIPETEAAEVVAASAGRRQAILVLGMHRSGTSAVGGAINLLGISAPKTLMPANADNPRGYWESHPLYLANDELLASVGSAWHDWRRLDPKWMKSRDAQAWRQRIEEVIIEEYGDKPLLFIKDPRICRFLPFFLSVLSELRISPVALLPVRNPLEVAHSLRRRNNFTVSRSILIWLRHVLEAEYYSRNIPRSFLLYDRFLVDWRQSLLHTARHIGVVWPEYSGESAANVDQFLSSELRRERSTLEELGDNPDVTSLALAVFKIISEVIANGEQDNLTEALDRLREKFDESCDVFGIALRAEELSGEQLRTALQRQTTDVERRGGELVSAGQRLGLVHGELGGPRQAEADLEELVSAADAAHAQAIEALERDKHRVEQQLNTVQHDLAASRQREAELQGLHSASEAAHRQTVGLLEREKEDLEREKQDVEDELRAALSGLEMEATLLAQQLQGIVSSTSWKVSAPVRIVGRRLPALARVGRRMLRSFWRLG